MKQLVLFLLLCVPLNAQTMIFIGRPVHTSVTYDVPRVVQPKPVVRTTFPTYVKPVVRYSKPAPTAVYRVTTPQPVYPVQQIIQGFGQCIGNT